MRQQLYSIALLFLNFCAASLPAQACPDVDGVLDVNCDGEVHIVAFGDSITYGRADEEDLGYPGRLNLLLPSTTVHNLGNPGENTYSGKWRASKVIPWYPYADFIIVLEGVNDYWVPDHSTGSTKSNIFSIVRTGENVGAIALIANLTDILRSNERPWVRSVNAALAPYKDIDFYSLGPGIISGDLIHPDGDGYQQMAQLLIAVLRYVTEQNRPVDTDNDNMYDFGEAKYGTDPFNPDTDGDGLRDGDEVFVYHSSPLVLDTDADGFTDPEEVQMGADPADPKPGAPTLKAIEVLPSP